MEMKTAYPATLEDIVFEGRNKAYGAYMLRKLYSKHVTQAAILAITGSVALFMVPSAVKKFMGQDNTVIPEIKKEEPTFKITEVKLTDIKQPKVEPITPPADQPAPAVQPTAKTITFTTPKVMDNPPVEAEVPSIEEFKSADAGVTNNEGTGGAVGVNVDSETGNGAVGGTGEGTGTETNAIFEAVEHMPQFEGGMAALMKYIGKELRYPSAAQRAGVEGTVILSFVVGPTGAIDNITVLKGLGYGTEEEAIRVLKKLPKWKPGIQNGRAVSVRMTLPIKLQLR